MPDRQFIRRTSKSTYTNDLITVERTFGSPYADVCATYSRRKTHTADFPTTEIARKVTWAFRALRPRPTSQLRLPLGFECIRWLSWQKFSQTKRNSTFRLDSQASLAWAGISHGIGVRHSFHEPIDS